MDSQLSQVPPLMATVKALRNLTRDLPPAQAHTVITPELDTELYAIQTQALRLLYKLEDHLDMITDPFC